MMERPELSRHLDSKTFREFYYLKEDLVAFCRENSLPASGGKIEITDRIAHFLDTGETLAPSTPKRKAPAEFVIHEGAEIESDFVCSERHRAFFKERIGKGFSFSVPFQAWLKSNPGKTYGEAVKAYHKLLADKKKGSSPIDKQFEYNTYIRDFFAGNDGRSLEEAIRCWKYKKALPGNNRYEASDLAALEEQTAPPAHIERSPLSK